jgi:hypothetical protein
MLRRELLRAAAGMAALHLVPRDAEAAVAVGRRLHDALKPGADFRTLTPAQQRLVAALCDRILPATDTPGALDVRVPEFIDLWLTERESDAGRVSFVAGLDDIDRQGRAAGGAFVDLPEESKLALMRTLDATRGDGSPAGRVFGRLKALTVFGYFTSERVTKEVLKTRTSFRAFDGCAPVTT